MQMDLSVRSGNRFIYTTRRRTSWVLRPNLSRCLCTVRTLDPRQYINWRMLIALLALKMTRFYARLTRRTIDPVRYLQLLEVALTHSKGTRLLVNQVLLGSIGPCCPIFPAERCL
jgi:hypothetical protein